jgi:hypothetical protein
MDGATSELGAAGYGRAFELKALGESFARLWSGDLIDWLETSKRGYFRRVEQSLRGLPAHAHDWPEWCWERFCDDADSSDIAERDLLAMRAPFVAECALRLDDAGYDCR